MPKLYPFKSNREALYRTAGKLVVWTDARTGLRIVCKVHDVRQRYGGFDLLIEPLVGEGSAWVQATKVSLIIEGYLEPESMTHRVAMMIQRLVQHKAVYSLPKEVLAEIRGIWQSLGGLWQEDTKGFHDDPSHPKAQQLRDSEYGRRFLERAAAPPMDKRVPVDTRDIFGLGGWGGALSDKSELSWQEETVLPEGVPSGPAGKLHTLGSARTPEVVEPDPVNGPVGEGTDSDAALGGEAGPASTGDLLPAVSPSREDD